MNSNTSLNISYHSPEPVLTRKNSIKIDNNKLDSHKSESNIFSMKNSKKNLTTPFLKKKSSEMDVNVNFTIEDKYLILNKIMYTISVSPSIARSLFLCIIEKIDPKESLKILKMDEKKEREVLEMSFSKYNYFSYEAHKIIFCNLNIFCFYKYHTFIKLFLNFTI